MNKRQDFYYWRLPATAACFALFGIGGLLLRLTVFPLIGLFVHNRAVRTQLSRKVVQASFRLFIEIMRVSGVLTYSVKGKELLNQPGRLIIANHPSLIDVVFLISLIEGVSCIIKDSLLKNPFMRGPILNADYIPNEPSEAMSERCSALLARGESLIIFPEGTRTPAGKPVKFQRGAAYLAIKSNTRITLVDIRCSPSTLTKKDKWYQIPYNRPHFEIRVIDDLPPLTSQYNGYISQQARQVTRQWEAFFNMEITA